MGQDSKSPRHRLPPGTYRFILHLGQRLATDGGLSNSGKAAADPDATQVDPANWRLVTIRAKQKWADGTSDTWEASL